MTDGDGVPGILFLTVPHWPYRSLGPVGRQQHEHVSPSRHPNNLVPIGSLDSNAYTMYP